MPLPGKGSEQPLATITGDAMTAVVERYGDEMLRLAMLYLGSREQAEDAVQDSFIKIFRAAHGDQISKSFVMRVLVNTCKDYLKSGWAKNVTLMEQCPEVAAEGGPVPVTEEGALRREILELPPKYREVILLRYYEGFAVGEIAHMLNAPQPTVSIRIRRACKLLEKRLEGVPREDM